jgi:magnesium chelatase subunit D
MTETTQNEFNVWDNALLAAAVVCVAPSLVNGLIIKALPGPIRDAWMNIFNELLPKQAQLTKIPLNVTEDRLLGGLDLAATLNSSTPIIENGLLANANNGYILLPMAERCSSITIACLCSALDFKNVHLERDGISLNKETHFAVVAIDESEASEEVHPALTDRLGIHINLQECTLRDITPAKNFDINSAIKRLPKVITSDDVLNQICMTASVFGIQSLRAAMFTANVARTIAALHHHKSIEDNDLALATQLVLAPRATMLPAETPKDQQDDQQPDQKPDKESENNSKDEQDNNLDDNLDQEDREDQDARKNNEELPEELILDATHAAIPSDLLQSLSSNAINRTKSSTAGKAGGKQKTQHRGRPIGTTQGLPVNGKRLNVLATLRAAVPWQKIRCTSNREENRSEINPPKNTSIKIRSEDFRITRFKQKSESATIFVVDASGSSALNRLSEVKGAVELVLAECYVRRDQVALIAFRGEKAEVLLPPTHSLVCAKRSLANLPGGGGTPLASAIDNAYLLAIQIKQRGATPTIVFLTDGRANVARDGTHGRQQAFDDALTSARNISIENFRTLVIDTSPRPHANGKKLAEAMHAEYLPLPYADAASLSNIVQTQQTKNAA